MITLLIFVAGMVVGAPLAITLYLDLQAGVWERHPPSSARQIRRARRRARADLRAALRRKQ